jgi:hypothetical protein
MTTEEILAKLRVCYKDIDHNIDEIDKLETQFRESLKDCKETITLKFSGQITHSAEEIHDKVDLLDYLLENPEATVKDSMADAIYYMIEEYMPEYEAINPEMFDSEGNSLGKVFDDEV